MNRLYATVGVLALVLLAVGALSVTFADRVAGQSASPAASVPAAAPAAAASAPADGSTVEPLSNPIDNTGCDVNAGNPHIAQSIQAPTAKGYGTVFRCNEKKDQLAVRTQLLKKGNNGDTTWSVVDEKYQDCFTCYKTGIGAVRHCDNRRDNEFKTIARGLVYNNGSSHADTGESRAITLDCGGF